MLSHTTARGHRDALLPKTTSGVMFQWRTGLKGYWKITIRFIGAVWYLVIMLMVMEHGRHYVKGVLTKLHV